MKRKILLILFLCGLVALSVVLEYRARAETSTCSPRGLCIPIKPPDCVKPDGDVTRPLVHRSCEHAWRDYLIGDAIRCPQRLCFVCEKDKLSTVARVFTLDIGRAMGR